MKMLLPSDGPLDVARTLARYRTWGDDPANQFDGAVFRRVLRLDGRLIPYSVRGSGPVDDARLAVDVAGRGGAAVRDAVTAEVRAIFGLDFDLPGFYRFAKGDRVLGVLTERLYGFRPTLSPTPLEMFVGSITAQQVNLTFAFALRARLVRRWGTPVATAGTVVYAFPDAPTLAAARVRDFREMQFSERKAEYVIGIADEIASGRLELAALTRATDADVIDRLTRIRGFGRWTADWYLARCLGRGACCAAGDLGVRKAFEHYYGRGRSLSELAIRRRARTWAQYQNLATHYLLVGHRAEAAGKAEA
jgi:DNA-3-methyladenine glycosylase II